MKLMSRSFPFLVYIFIISSILSGFDEDAYSYTLNFETPKTDKAHFIINIDFSVKDGYYASSCNADPDEFQFQTRLEWPEKQCLDNKGDELNDEDGFPIYDERDCIEGNGLWQYSNYIWIEDLEKYHNATIFKKINDMEESKPHLIKDNVPIQKGDFKITQEYMLVDDLEDGLYIFKADFVYQVCADYGLCVPKSDQFTKKIKISNLNNKYILDWDNKAADLNTTEINSECEFLDEEESSLIGSFFTAILAGLIAIITPCVFPMIPMTVAFFAKDAKKGKEESIKTGLLFGASIIVIFTVIGVLFSALFGATLANELATSAVANIIFAIIFLVFAISFFGYFEIRVPNTFLNRINKKADGGGLLGVFFMALTLVLVSFSCTAPIVGTVMIDAVAGNFIKPIIVMLGFSIAFAVPFSLFAIFPSWLESLPQSGGWLNSVKVVLGFLELALCIKFLSMPDQAYHWGILSRDTFLILWIIIFGAMGFYILGYIKFQHDSVVEKLSIQRIFIAIITFSFCIYMVSGLFGNRVSALAGIIPPAYNLKYNNISESTGVCSEILIKYSDKLHLPPGFKGYFDYEEALECAKKQNKPLFIDFTGHACFNCRRMEENVWIAPEVKKILDLEYIIVALYVDDKTPLSNSKKYKTLGKKNFALQMDKFCSNAQPYYVLLDPYDESVLVKPKAYDTNINNFVDFLNNGKKKFNQKKGL